MIDSMMNHNNLSVYLNDHLAGSVAGVEILDQLTDLLKDSEFGAAINSVRGEIEHDRDALEALAERLEIRQSSIRKASGWLAEKAVTLKLLVDDPGSGPLRIFESLEALSLGIEGKRLLWTTLADIARNDPRIDSTECSEMIGRSEDQRHRVETMRRDVAQKAFIDVAE